MKRKEELYLKIALLMGLAGISGVLGYNDAISNLKPQIEILRDGKKTLTKFTKRLINNNQKLKEDNEMLRKTTASLAKQMNDIQADDAIPANEPFVINVGDEEKDIFIIAKRYASMDGEQTKMYYYQNALNEKDCYMSWNYDTSIIAGTLYVDERKTKTLLQTIPVDAMQDSYTKEELEELQNNINTNNFTYQKTK